jgi:hypothetical protein
MGAAILSWTWKTSNRIKAAVHWPVAQGQVISSSVGRDSTRIRGGGYNHYLVPNIRYQYAVDGKSYTSATVVFGVRKRFKTQAEAEEEIAVFPVGRGVPVHYDPADPSVASLEAGAVPSVMPMLQWMSALFLLIGLIAIVSGILSIRRFVRENL